LQQLGARLMTAGLWHRTVACLYGYAKLDNWVDWRWDGSRTDNDSAVSWCLTTRDEQWIIYTQSQLMAKHRVTARLCRLSVDWRLISPYDTTSKLTPPLSQSTIIQLSVNSLTPESTKLRRCMTRAYCW